MTTTTDYPEELRELFSRIGQILKEARESAGMSLQDISALTRINQSFLALLETGELDRLPSLAFVKGFVRNYMHAIEFEDESFEALIQELNVLDGKETPQQSQSPKHNLFESDSVGFPILKVGLGAGLVVMIIVVGFFLIRGPGQAEAPETQTAPAGESQPAANEQAPPGGTQATSEDRANAPTPGQDNASQDSGQALRPATGTPSATPVEGRQKLELTIRGLERTWVRLSQDRSPPVDVLIEPAETVGWEANQEFQLTIGKSHGVAIYLNGEEFLIPQEKNQLVRDLVLNKLTLLRLEN